jgi:anaerobic nitric oxide reductase transcription regulator
MKQLEAILTIATDLTSSLSSKDRYQRLLQVVTSILKSDAAALFKKEKNGLRVLVTENITESELKPTYPLRENPRLEVICRSKTPVIFPADSPLPDPFDAHLVNAMGAEHRVHSCLGCPLIVGNELVGVLTADSLAPGAFDDLDLKLLSTLSALAGAALQTSELLHRLETTAEKKELVARDLMRSLNEQAGPFLLGNSAAMDKLREEIHFAAQTDLTVLISGETGVGKELVARSIQARSRRKNQPMIYVNCAALPENIVESELFGHVKGAFTGAEKPRAGKFEVADGGTLFLDEIGELPLAVQAKLLRALQEGEVQRVGSDQHRKVDVRVVAATNRNLEQEVAQGRFRADLFYRLNVYPISVPALRDHSDDIPYLTAYFCDLHQRKVNLNAVHVTPDAMKTLQAYSWPGNVRELKNILDRTVLKAKLKNPTLTNIHIGQADLPADLLAETATTENSALSTGLLPQEHQGAIARISLREATDEFQRRVILHEVQANQGNWAAAAKRLGMHRSNLFALASRLGLK